MKYFKKYLKIIKESAEDRAKILQSAEYKKFISFIPNKYESDFNFIVDISSKTFSGKTSTGDKQEIAQYKEEIDKFTQIIEKLKDNPNIKNDINVLLNFVKEQIEKNKNDYFQSEIKQYFLNKLNMYYKGYEKDIELEKFKEKIGESKNILDLHKLALELKNTKIYEKQKTTLIKYFISKFEKILND